MAVDCRTFNYSRGIPLAEIVRGDGFIINSKIFPSGTLSTGNQTNDPNNPGSVGTLVSRGTTTATLAEHLANPSSPAIFHTQHLLLNNGMIVSEGWFAPGGTNEGAVVGGTRAFRGASGELSAVNIGTNSTGCPNTRLTIILQKQVPNYPGWPE